MVDDLDLMRRALRFLTLRQSHRERLMRQAIGRSFGDRPAWLDDRAWSLAQAAGLIAHEPVEGRPRLGDVLGQTARVIGEDRTLVRVLLTESGRAFLRNEIA